jgi:ATP-dependent helicase/nuclease subunit B
VGWARARLDELRREMPPPSDEVFARESRDLCDDLEAFLVAECEGRHGEDPVGFEVAFGYPVQDGDEPLALAEPLVLEFSRSRGLVLHGRIDRINRLKAGEYEVVDYKTGGFWRDDWAGNFAAGTRLQHAIYGCAAAELLKPVDARARVTRGRYVFPSVKGHGRQKIITAPARDDLVRVLRDLTDVIGGGLFVAAEDDGPCRWCDFAAACHPQAGEGTAGKVAHEANAMLAPYRRLRRHA